MRKIVLALLLLGIIGWSGTASALQCVPFARQVSGLSLQGDAWRWWSAAEGVYERGNAPAPGSVLVFKSTSKMRFGHVAVVSRIVSRREIRVDHANWGQGRNRGRIDRDVAVIDVSPRNDWTQVRVWHSESAGFGNRVNPVYGFIYPPGRTAVQAVASHASPRPEVTKTPNQVAAQFKVSLPAVKPAARGASRPAADDLNRLVLARLAAESPQMQPAASARPKVALGEKRPAPKPSGSVAVPTGTKTKATADRRRS